MLCWNVECALLGRPGVGSAPPGCARTPTIPAPPSPPFPPCSPPPPHPPPSGRPRQLASGGVSWAVNDRQAEALVKAHEGLMRACESVEAGLPLDFWTVDLRAALLALGEVSGDDVTEEVLDSVFSKFCLGK